ncbi:MAG TPA: transposase [Gammaproteobacteria bacterium]|nr:transposase [Gammaproteobacteria bacterium]
MKRKRYTEEKIMAMLKAHEARVSVPELSRRHGLAENTIYRWKPKFGGRKISEAKRLCEREAKNSKIGALPTSGSNGSALG